MGVDTSQVPYTFTWAEIYREPDGFEFALLRPAPPFPPPPPPSAGLEELNAHERDEVGEAEEDDLHLPPPPPSPFHNHGHALTHARHRTRRMPGIRIPGVFQEPVLKPWL